MQLYIQEKIILHSGESNISLIFKQLIIETSRNGIGN